MAKDSRAAALPKKGKGSKEWRTLRDLAQEYGYSPGEFSIYRMADNVYRIRRWMNDLKHGVIPPDFATSGMNISQVTEIVMREAREIAIEELKWADYFHPKLKSTENKHTDGEGGPIKVNVVFKD